MFPDSNNHFNIEDYQRNWADLIKWYQTELGQLFYQAEKQIIDDYLDACFGFYLLQLGGNAETVFYDCARTKHKLLINCIKQSGQQLQSWFEHSAIKNNSIDTIILFHVLELSPDPHQVLREVDRILVAEGKVIIVAFNPFSLFGLWHIYKNLRQLVFKTDSVLPRQMSLLSAYRVQDWLSLLGFETESKASVFFRPPLNNSRLMKKIYFMEKVGQQYWPFISSAYVLQATKRVSTLTPLKKQWSIKKKNLIGVKVPEPQRKTCHNSRTKDG